MSALSWLWWWRPPCRLKLCIVNLKDDPTTAIRGVLWSVRGPWLTFKNGALLKAGQEPTPIDGDVIIHRTNLQFLQVP